MLRLITLLPVLLAINACNSDTKMNTMKTTSNQYYSVVWKYVIHPETRDIFEAEYGSKGTWATFFSQSEDYLGSFLHKSEDDPNTYLLVDTWTNRAAYDRFTNTKRTEYDKISSGFEYLYISEDKIGSFITVP